MIVAQDLFHHARDNRKITTLRLPSNRTAKYFTDLVIDLDAVIKIANRRIWFAS